MECWYVDCSHSSVNNDCSFRALPSSECSKRIWIRYAGITGGIRGKTPLLCSCHFNESNEHPIPFFEGKRKREQCQDDQTLIRKWLPSHLRIETTPSQHLPCSKGASTSRGEPEIIHTIDFTLPVIEFVAIKAEPIDDEDIDEKRELPMVMNRSEDNNNDAVIVKTENVSTDDGLMTALNIQSVGTQTSFINMRVTYDSITDSELIYATGINRKKFDIILDRMERHSPIAQSSVDVKKDLLLVTLFLIRHNYMNLTMVEFIFGLSRSTISTFYQDSVKKLQIILEREDIWHDSFTNSKEIRCLMENIEKYRNRKKSWTEKVFLKV